MPSLRYINQTAPFWDFVASLEEQGTSHPFLNNRDRDGPEEPGRPWFPWGAWGARPPPFGPHHFPHGGFGPRGPHPPPPPPPLGPDGPDHHPHHHGHHFHHPPPPPPPDAGSGNESDEKSSPPPPQNPEDGPQNEPRSPGSERRRHHGCRGRGRGRGGFGGPPFWAAHGGAPGLNWANLAEAFRSHPFFNLNPEGDEASGQEDFKPEADIFDTEASFIVHVSLPGAKKDDIGVSWDPEKSELTISGVIHRPGDEEFLKTLAVNERKVGAFEKKIRLGSRANPAQVDHDATTAKLEDGVLVVEVPKLDKDYVEIKKVDIE